MEGYILTGRVFPFRSPRAACRVQAKERALAEGRSLQHPASEASRFYITKSPRRNLESMREGLSFFKKWGGGEGWISRGHRLRRKEACGLGGRKKKGEQKLYSVDRADR